jgi:hypothetical protein
MFFFKKFHIPDAIEINLSDNLNNKNQFISGINEISRIESVCVYFRLI